MYPGAYVAEFPDKPAVVKAGTDHTITYRELDAQSTRLARYLSDAGLRRGDHLALLTDNDPKAFEVYWAALRSGLYITAVNRHLSADEISYIVNDCEAKALVVSAGVGEAAEKIVADTPGVTVRLAYNGPVPHHDDYADALARTSSKPLEPQLRGIDMLYSSGTTGKPKGIKPDLPSYRVDEPGDVMTAVTGPLYGFGRDTVYLSPAPIYHAAPLRICGTVHSLGGTVILMDKFDPEAALSAIERYRVTHSQWVPTMFIRMLKLDEEARNSYDLSSHRVAIHAAAPCPPEVKRAMIDWWGPILYEYYASTEGNGFAVIASEEWLRKPGSVGRAKQGIPHICGEDGEELRPGQVGLIYFEWDKPPFRYHNDPEKTARTQHPRHPTWITIGDIGYLDEDGYLFLTDRKDFMIISGGVNIYPREVEDALALHPKVLDVAVIGVPDPEMGEAVKAVVQPAAAVVPGPQLADELTAYLRERIAHFKIPRSFDFTTELPRTPTGKLVKRELSRRYT